ncbi:MAG: hypothetical protein KTR24_12845 [Saprospiraceae bacterium]|nr:hypothetical protein [Saprospiraceae bacterium]
MKKRLFLLLAGGLFFVGLTSMMMDPPENTECKEVCVEIADVLDVSLGACMGACNPCLNKGKGNGPVCTCKSIKLFSGADFKLGDCVSFFNSNSGG